MGRDKATLPTPDGPLASIVVRALLGAGAHDVLLVGGAGAELTASHLGTGASEGVEWVPDLWPGDGPLGGVATAATARPDRALVVCACDLPGITSDDLHPLVRAVSIPPTWTPGSPGTQGGTAEIAVVEVGGVAQWSVLALGPSGAAAARRAFEAGERALRHIGGAAGLAVTHLRPERPAAFADVDAPTDLPPGWTVGRVGSPERRSEAGSG